MGVSLLQHLRAAGKRWHERPQAWKFPGDLFNPHDLSHPREFAVHLFGDYATSHEGLLQCFERTDIDRATVNTVRSVRTFVNPSNPGIALFAELPTCIILGWR